MKTDFNTLIKNKENLNRIDDLLSSILDKTNDLNEAVADFANDNYSENTLEACIPDELAYLQEPLTRCLNALNELRGVVFLYKQQNDKTAKKELF